MCFSLQLSEAMPDVKRKGCQRAVHPENLHSEIEGLSFESPVECACDSMPTSRRGDINRPQRFGRHQLAETQDLAGIVNRHKRDDAFVGLHLCQICGNALSINWPAPQVQDHI